jgi:predicted amidophosphoribosyltransferase
MADVAATLRPEAREIGGLVILVDDVATSGLTMLRARQALAAAGLGSLGFVWAWYHGLGAE